MSDKRNDDVTPESLMDFFRGPGLMKMIVVTVIFHIVVVVVSSLPYLKKTVFGADTSNLTKEEKIEQAVSDATSALRKIAAEHGLNPQDISDQFAAGGSRTAKQVAPVAEERKDTGTESPTAEAVPEKPKSAIEKQLETSVHGPQMPAAPAKDDIF